MPTHVNGRVVHGIQSVQPRTSVGLHQGQMSAGMFQRAPVRNPYLKSGTKQLSSIRLFGINESTEEFKSPARHLNDKLIYGGEAGKENDVSESDVK